MSFKDPTPEEIARAKAKQHIISIRNRIRTHLMKDEEDKAMALAARHGVELFSARLSPEFNHPSEVKFVELEKKFAHLADQAKKQQEIEASIPPPVVEKEGKSLNGWPVKADVIIWSLCHNPKIVVIQLPDGRQASMYRGQRRWKVYDKTEATLVEWTADPIYEAVQPPAPYVYMQPMAPHPIMEVE